MTEARQIVLALKGVWHGSYGMCCCPAHQDRTPSLSIRDGGDGMVLVHCHAGCDQSAVIDALKARGLWEQPPAGGRFRPTCGTDDREARDLDNDQRTKVARGLWKKAGPVENTPVETYLRGRGITCPIPPTIRYLAATKHSGTGLWLPCMIAGVAIWPSREISGIHRTFLTIDGRKKSPVSNNKMMLGPVRGGAVRLADVGAELVVGEGIESCLSVLQATGKPTWASLSTSGMDSLILPDEARDIIIAADHDQPGLRAARRAADRWVAEGRRVRIAKPTIEDSDWNDVLMLPENVVALPDRREARHG
jgi:hypothetical protein